MNLNTEDKPKPILVKNRYVCPLCESLLNVVGDHSIHGEGSGFEYSEYTTTYSCPNCDYEISRYSA